MGWVRRTQDVHKCDAPRPERNGIWRCDECTQLWAADVACPACRAGYSGHGGSCLVGLTWRYATLLERLRFGRTS